MAEAKDEAKEEIKNLMDSVDFFIKAINDYAKILINKKALQIETDIIERQVFMLIDTLTKAWKQLQEKYLLSLVN